ncbi:MAG: metalloregulator ArsR/SmtB family transcription factor [candidate division Zixibacteria bacterium]|nr:metalloregulator ArsR/SmtB family transcription factor [candidate division Zixibacteria bacterium]
MLDENLLLLESGLLKAISQPTRLRILYFLKEGEKCACEIIPEMGEDQSTISRHLNHLKDSGILDSRREGVSIYYRIKDERVFDLLHLVDEIIRIQVKEKAKTVKVI